MTNAPERIWAHPLEREPRPANERKLAPWVRGGWKNHDSGAHGDVEYIRADLVPGWQPIETAPRDGTPVLVWYNHDADPYEDPFNPGNLTDYAAWAEVGDYKSGKGAVVAKWFDREWELQDEYGSGFWMPAVWRVLIDEWETVCNPTHWMPLPEPPQD